MDRYLTLKQLSELLSIKEVTLRVMIHRGLDIPHLKVNSMLRFPTKKLERWLEQKEQERKRRRFEI